MIKIENVCIYFILLYSIWYFPGVAGLILSYTLTCQQSLYWGTKLSADLEKAVVSVERVNEYQKVDNETDIMTGKYKNHIKYILEA